MALANGMRESSRVSEPRDALKNAAPARPAKATPGTLGSAARASAAPGVVRPTPPPLPVPASPGAAPRVGMAVGPDYVPKGAMRAASPTSPGVGDPPMLATDGDSRATPPNGSPVFDGLSPRMRDEVAILFREAVEEGLAPFVERQRELEAKIRGVESELVARSDVSRPASPPVARTGYPTAAPEDRGRGSAASKLASLGPLTASSAIPVSFEASVAPPRIAPDARVPRFESEPARSPLSTLSAVPLPVSRGSIPATGYGVTVITASGATALSPPPRAATSFDAFEMSLFDGGKRKKRIARFTVALMLLLVASAVTMSVLSHG